MASCIVSKLGHTLDEFIMNPKGLNKEIFNGFKVQTFV